MKPLSRKQEQKTKELEWAVFDLSVDEFKKFYTWRKRARYTARALGFACRYRGLDMVRAMINKSADFSYCPVRVANEKGDMKENSQLDYSLALLRYVPSLDFNGFYKIAEQEKQTALPLDERLRILEYLCGNAWFACFDPNRFLLHAALSNDLEMVAILQSRGAVVPEDRANIAVGKNESGHSVMTLYSSLYSDRLSDEEFIAYITQLNMLLGGKMFKADFRDLRDRFKSDKIPPEWLFKNFNFGDRNFNANLIRDFIDSQNTKMLELAEKYGVLKNISLINEMIAYSAEHGKTECTAFLLDYKNRTFDLAAEHKTENRELTLDNDF